MAIITKNSKVSPRKQVATKEQPSDSRILTRWGFYEIITPITEIAPGIKVMVKKLHINPDQCISYQFHNTRSEVWRVIAGSGLLLTDTYSYLEQDQVVTISPKQLHRVWGGSHGIDIEEVWVGSDLREEDIVRIVE